jgi:hypothetical protein
MEATDWEVKYRDLLERQLEERAMQMQRQLEERAMQMQVVYDVQRQLLEARHATEMAEIRSAQRSDNFGRAGEILVALGMTAGDLFGLIRGDAIRAEERELADRRIYEVLEARAAGEALLVEAVHAVRHIVQTVIDRMPDEAPEGPDVPQGGVGPSLDADLCAKPNDANHIMDEPILPAPEGTAMWVVTADGETIGVIAPCMSLRDFIGRFLRFMPTGERTDGTPEVQRFHFVPMESMGYTIGGPAKVVTISADAPLLMRIRAMEQ